MEKLLRAKGAAVLENSTLKYIKEQSEPHLIYE